MAKVHKWQDENDILELRDEQVGFSGLTYRSPNQYGLGNDNVFNNGPPHFLLL